MSKLLSTGTYAPDRTLHHTHTGSIGQPANEEIRAAFDKVYKGIES